MNILEISEEFERLVQLGQIRFEEAPLESLDDWTKTCVQFMLIPYGLTWKVGFPRVGVGVCLKVNDSLLQFLDVYPETQQFMWCTDGHRSGVHPDHALIRCLELLGIDASLQNDNISIDNGRIEFHDKRLPGGSREFVVTIEHEGNDSGGNRSCS
jgi:hypothetical protein